MCSLALFYLKIGISQLARKKVSTCVIIFSLSLSFLILCIGLTIVRISPMLVYSICEYNIGRRDIFLQSNYDIRLMMFDTDKIEETLRNNSMPGAPVNLRYHRFGNLHPISVFRRERVREQPELLRAISEGQRVQRDLLRRMQPVSRAGGLHRPRNGI